MGSGAKSRPSGARVDVSLARAVFCRAGWASTGPQRKGFHGVDGSDRRAARPLAQDEGILHSSGEHLKHGKQPLRPVLKLWIADVDHELPTPVSAVRLKQCAMCMR